MGKAETNAAQVRRHRVDFSLQKHNVVAFDFDQVEGPHTHA